MLLFHQTVQNTKFYCHRFLFERYDFYLLMVLWLKSFFPYNVVASDPLWNHPSNQLDRFARGMILRLLVFIIYFVAADIVFIVKDKPHQIFQRDSDNIIYTATIPLLKVSLFIAEAYSEPCQSPKMELFSKKNSHLKVLTTFAKSFILIFARVLNTLLYEHIFS